MAQLVASVSGVVLGGVAMVKGSSLARGEIFTASIGSVDSLWIHYIPLYKYIRIYKHMEIEVEIIIYSALVPC